MRAPASRATLRRVTLPLAWPGMLAAGIYIFTIGFAAFDVPAIIGWANRIFTFSTYLVLQLSPTRCAAALRRRRGAVGAADRLRRLLQLVVRAACRARAHRYQVVTGKAYRPRSSRSAARKAPAWSFVGALFRARASCCRCWSSSGRRCCPISSCPRQRRSPRHRSPAIAGLPWDLIGDGLGNTAAPDGADADAHLGAQPCASPGWCCARACRGRGWFDFVAFLPHAVPNIVFGVGALLFALFVLAAMRAALRHDLAPAARLRHRAHLSYATRMTNSGLIQIHSELEESATVERRQHRRHPARDRRAAAGADLALCLAVDRAADLPRADPRVLLTTRDNITLPVVIWSCGSAAASAMPPRSRSSCCAA